MFFVVAIVAVAIPLILFFPMSSKEVKLFHALGTRDPAMLRAVLVNGNLANSVDSRGTPAISVAIERLDSKTRELVDLLLAHGANPNAVDSQGRTPFHLLSLAVGDESVNKTIVVLEVGRSLVLAGGDPEQPDWQGRKPRDFAQEQNSAEMIGYFKDLDNDVREGWLKVRRQTR